MVLNFNNKRKVFTNCISCHPRRVPVLILLQFHDCMYVLNKNIVNHINAERLSWFGHLHRILEDRVVKRVYKWKPMFTRPLERPKNRWEDDITNDMKKLKIKNWTSCIQDRKKRKLNVEKAKTFKE